MLRAYLAIFAALVLAASTSSAITDAQLVGTWEPSAPDMMTVHGTPTITYHGDHTCTHKGYGEDGPSLAHGTWRLRGRKLTVRFGDLVVRETILTTSPDQFKTRFTIDGRETIFTYTRIKRQP